MAPKKRFEFVNHPWISFCVLIILLIISMLLTAIIIFGLFRLPRDDQYNQFLQALFGHILMVFVFVPFILRLPRGERSFKEYLDDIRLTRIRPFFQLISIAVSCYVILMLCQSLGSFVFRFAEGKPITGEFIRSVFNIKRELPPESLSLLISLPSAFEEVVFRGVLLTFLLFRYSKRKAIIFSSFGFAIIHILNLFGGREPAWVGGQMVWAFILGLFYGYLFIRTGSLLPNMLFHYLSNVFVGSFNYYIQSTASTEMQALYGVIFTFGILPTVLMILWIKFFATKWQFDSRF